MPIDRDEAQFRIPGTDAAAPMTPVHIYKAAPSSPANPTDDMEAMMRPEKPGFKEIWIEPWFRMASFVLGVWSTLAALAIIITLATLIGQHGNGN